VGVAPDAGALASERRAGERGVAARGVVGAGQAADPEAEEERRRAEAEALLAERRAAEERRKAEDAEEVRLWAEAKLAARSRRLPVPSLAEWREARDRERASTAQTASTNQPSVWSPA
jgi:hypothetical protein